MLAPTVDVRWLPNEACKKILEVQPDHDRYHGVDQDDGGFLVMSRLRLLMVFMIFLHNRRFWKLAMVQLSRQMTGHSFLRLAAASKDCSDLRIRVC